MSPLVKPGGRNYMCAGCPARSSPAPRPSVLPFSEVNDFTWAARQDQRGVPVFLISCPFDLYLTCRQNIRDAMGLSDAANGTHHTTPMRACTHVLGKADTQPPTQSPIQVVPTLPRLFLSEEAGCRHVSPGKKGQRRRACLNSSVLSAVALFPC